MKQARNLWRQELSKLIARTDKDTIRIQKSGVKSSKDKRQLFKAIDYLGLILVSDTPKTMVYAIPQVDGNNRINDSKGE
jgi:hypothetical protein